MSTLKHPLKRNLWSLLLLFVALYLGGCSSGAVKGESPFAQVGGWSIDGSTLRLDLRLRNVNDEALAISALDLKVTVDGNVDLVQLRQTVSVSIPAGGLETVQLRATATDAGLALLDSLAREERASLGYRLEGAVDSPDEGSLRFRHDGHIYRVPGRPGEFR